MAGGTAEGDGRRATIAEPVELRGRGLHSGAAVCLRLRPAPPESGVVFRADAGQGAFEVPARLASVVDARNATSLGGARGAVRTVEHLLAALHAHGIDDVRVELDAAEPPIGDGSAAPFVALLARAGVRRHGGPRRVAEIAREIVIRDGEREIAVEPHAAFAVAYEIDFASAAIGRQSLALPRLDAACFDRELARARTFGFAADAERLRAAGLALGASPENTIVIDGDRVLGEAPLRWPDEFVRHKLLDLVGDLALLGHPLRGRVRVRRGGHALHHALLRRLAETPGAYRLVAG